MPPKRKNNASDEDYAPTAKAKAAPKRTKVTETPSAQSPSSNAAPSLKVNGEPRKPRDPRGHLFPWTDDNYRRALLAIVAVCGEDRINIPWDQAAKHLHYTDNDKEYKLTGSAFQQGILKLRDKQVANGNFVPKLRMSWKSKTNKDKTASTSNATDTAGYMDNNFSERGADEGEYDLMDDKEPLIKAEEDSDYGDWSEDEPESLVVRLKLPPIVLAEWDAFLEFVHDRNFRNTYNMMCAGQAASAEDGEANMSPSPEFELHGDDFGGQ